eukprot:2698119-Amphidinium_carterae.1
MAVQRICGRWNARPNSVHTASKTEHLLQSESRQASNKLYFCLSVSMSLGARFMSHKSIASFVADLGLGDPGKVIK